MFKGRNHGQPFAAFLQVDNHQQALNKDKQSEHNYGRDAPYKAMEDSTTLFTHPVIIRGTDVEDGVTKTPCLGDCGLVGALNDRSAGVVDNANGHRGGCTLVREHAVVGIDLKLKNSQSLFFLLHIFHRSIAHLSSITTQMPNHIDEIILCKVTEMKFLKTKIK